MELSERKLPVKVRQCRRARILKYAVALGLIFGALSVPQRYLAIPLVAGIVIIFGLEIVRIMNVLEIERNKVTLYSGLLSTHANSVYYDKVTDIRISQTLWQRLLNYGSVYINTPGHDEYELVEVNIPKPHEVRNFVERLKHAYQKPAR